MLFCFVAAVVPFATGGGGRRSGCCGTVTAAAATATTAVPAATTARRPAGFHTGAVRDQRRPGRRAVRERVDRRRAAILWSGGALGSIPRAGGAAGATAGPAAAAPAHAAAGRAASERPGAVRDPLLRPRLAGDGRQERDAAEARIPRRSSRSPPVPRAHTPRRHARPAAAVTAAAAATTR